MANQEILEKKETADFEPEKSTTDINPTCLHPLEMIALGASEDDGAGKNQGEATPKNLVVSNGMAQEGQQNLALTSITDNEGRPILNSPFDVRGVVVVNKGVEQFHAVEMEDNEPKENDEEHPNTLTVVDAVPMTVSCAETNNGNLAEPELPASVLTNSQVTQTIEPSYVVIEQVALEQLNQLIAVTLTNPVVEPTTASQSNSSPCFSTQDSSEPISATVEQSDDKDDEQDESCIDQEFTSLDEADDVELDTKALAVQLTSELKRYQIPQAVFAKKVLHRSQGTLSDILRKPKPWSELKGGREIFKRMKQWLDLPEVKRIPQLRTEGTIHL